MLVAISDASVLVDLAEVRLLGPLVELRYQIAAPDFIIDEITRPEEKEATDALIREKKLAVFAATADDIGLIEQLQQGQARLSFADCSVVVLAMRHQALVLTNDSRLRSVCEGKGLTCHGTLWVFRQLLHEGLVTPEEALSALRRLTVANPRLPKGECSRLLHELERAVAGSR